MQGRLTTHVLDTAQGSPARAMSIEVWRIDDEGHLKLLKTVMTNGDGRTDVPLLSGGELQMGVYELVFAVGDYFDRMGLTTDDIPFLGRVPIRFGVSDPDVHYHVPLLASPWSYTTYRGS